MRNIEFCEKICIKKVKCGVHSVFFMNKSIKCPCEDCVILPMCGSLTSKTILCEKRREYLVGGLVENSRRSD